MAKLQQHPRGFKSNLVREFIQKYPNMGATQLVDKIHDERSIDISPQMVYDIKARAEENPVKKVRVKKESVLGEGIVNIERLAKIVKDCGGFEETKKLLKLIEAMQVTPQPSEVE
jgi:hypothetical protein